MSKLSCPTHKILIFFMVLSLVGCYGNIDPSIANTPFGILLLKYEFIIVLISLFGGIGCLIAGIALTVLGFAGSIEWIVEGAGFISRLTNASPGIVLMLIGGFLTYKSRIKIDSRKIRKNSKDEQ